MEPIHFRRDSALSVPAVSSSNLSRGFSLVELLVVIAIMIVITSMVITNQSSFNRTIVLTSTAYDVALSLRSAEGFGLGARASEGVVNTGYGIHFPAVPTSSYSLFADANLPDGRCHAIPSGGASSPDAQYGNCVYDAGEKISEYALGNGITISGLCVYHADSPNCHEVAGSLDIVFARPDANTFISTGGIYSATPVIRSACITLTSPQGGERYVSVTMSGMIMESATSCL